MSKVLVQVWDDKYCEGREVKVDQSKEFFKNIRYEAVDETFATAASLFILGGLEVKLGF